MSDREAYIYAPPSLRANWPVELLGQVLKPALDTAGGGLVWFWHTFYTTAWKDEPTAHKIDPKYQWSGNAAAFLKLRYAGDADRAFKHALVGSAGKAGCAVHLGRYNLAGDLGSDRYLSSSKIATPTDRPDAEDERAELLLNILHSASTLAVASLEQQQGGWRFEQNQHSSNPHRSVLQSVAHLMCNMFANQVIRVEDAQKKLHDGLA